MDLEHLVREAVAALEQRSPAGGSGDHRVVLEPLGTRRLPLVPADPRLLRDALDSVLDNALTYSPAGSTITVMLHVAPLPVGAPPRSGKDAALASAQPDAAVVIRVQDCRIGIPAEHLGRIFERFHRVESGPTRDGNGLGLGLAIVARIVALHGGIVWGESQLGAGSTLCLALPLASEDEADGDREVPSAGSSAETSGGSDAPQGAIRPPVLGDDIVDGIVS
jgi:two-component system, OmpR family, sensor histidine kinase VicK